MLMRDINAEYARKLTVRLRPQLVTSEAVLGMPERGVGGAMLLLADGGTA